MKQMGKYGNCGSTCRLVFFRVPAVLICHNFSILDDYYCIWTALYLILCSPKIYLQCHSLLVLLLGLNCLFAANVAVADNLLADVVVEFACWR